MLRIYDQNKSPLGYINKIKDVVRESDVENSDKSLSFTYCAKKGGKKIRNEYYVEDQENRYVVKEVSESSDGFPSFVCELDLEALESGMFQDFTVENSSLEDAANLAVAGTGWRIETDITRIRSVQQYKANPLTILKAIRDAWFCEMRLDAKEQIAYFYDEIGIDRGAYLISGLNLKKLSASTDSRDYYTRLIPIGKDDLHINNNGKNYVENYQYSNKVRELIWEDTNYEDAAELQADAEKKLRDISKPRTSYSVTINDLAKQYPKSAEYLIDDSGNYLTDESGTRLTLRNNKHEYSMLQFGLGDTITLIDEATGTRDKQRIVRLTEYEDNPANNTAEIANTFYNYHEKQAAIEKAVENYENISDSSGSIKSGIYVHGTMDGSQILVEVGNYSTDGGGSGGGYTTDLNSYATSISGQVSGVQEYMEIVNAKIGSLETTYLKATEAEIKYATIENLKVVDEAVHSIQGDYAEFKTVTAAELDAHAGIIDNLTGDFASYKQAMVQELSTAKGWMLEGSIGDAQIQSVSANKLVAGKIDTAIITIGSADGSLTIADNTIQVSDGTHTRVQIGKDADGDYNYALWDAQGKLIWDAQGLTESGIKRKIIRDSMVAEDAAIQGHKLDINSVVTSINGATTKITGTAVQVGDRTLDAAFTEQTQTITEQAETLKTQRTDINANRDMIKERLLITTYSADKEKNEKRLTEAESAINVMQGDIQAKVTKTDIIAALGDYSTTEQMESEIRIAQKEIRTEVSESYASKNAVNDLETWRKAADQKITDEHIIATVQKDHTLLKHDDVASSIMEYYLSDKQGQLAGGTWTEARPEIADGKYLWTRGRITYNNGDIRYTEGKCISDSEKTYVIISGSDGFVLRKGQKTTLTADVMVNGKIPEKEYSYVWYIKKDDDETYTKLGTGKTITVPANTFSGRAQIYCAAGSENDFYYTDEAQRTLTDEKGNKLTGSSVYDFPMNSGTYDLNYSDNIIAVAMTQAIQANDRFRFLVRGESESSFELTETAAKLISEKIDLTGYVTISDIAQSGKTEINGDNITTGKIKAARIDTADLFAQDITATGTIRGVTLLGVTGSFSGDVYANSFTLKDTELKAGNITVSYYYVPSNAGNSANGVREDATKFQVSVDGFIIENGNGMEVTGVTYLHTVQADSLFATEADVYGDIRIGGNAYAEDFVIGSDLSMRGLKQELATMLSNKYASADQFGDVNVKYGLTVSESIWAGGSITCVGDLTTQSNFGVHGQSTFAGYCRFNGGTNISSDERLKDIDAIDNIYESIFMSLTPVAYRYTYDKDHKRRFGYGAQSIERVLQDYGVIDDNLAMVRHDYFDREQYGLMDQYSVDYNDINTLTMWMTQKNVRKIEQLEHQIEMLKLDIEKYKKASA